MKRFLPKISLVIAILISLILFNTLTPKTILAAAPAATPEPTPYPLVNLPCNKSSPTNEDFHSLRPDQAAPCGTPDEALYCGNTLVFTESFNMVGQGDCNIRGIPGTFTCSPKFPVAKHNLYVYLDNSDLPILGNTELVKNSQNSGDTIDDATKMNEYVDWYLSGVNTKAEYGNPTESQIVNYSGPIQKLLPQEIAEAQRISVIKTADQNHNQMVVCANKTIQIPSWVPFIHGIGIGKSTAVPCYGGATKYRLNDWTGVDGGILNWESQLSQTLATLFPGTFTQILEHINNNIRWTNKEPPLPWDDGTGKPFTSDMAYQKAYNEWRGDMCAYLPNPLNGFKLALVCIGIPGLTNNEYADLFSYVPLAQSPDELGSEEINSGGIHIVAGSGTLISDANSGKTVNPPLYFAHTEDAMDLSNTLNETYIPERLKSVPVPQTTENNVCSVVQVESNPGDNLFPSQEAVPHPLNDKPLEVDDVTYNITQATCTETITQSTCYTPFEVSYPCTSDTIKCPADVTISMDTSTQTPNVNEIFSTTTSDSESTFRRIYPEVGPGAPVTCIADIPTVSNVDYNAYEDPHKSQIPTGATQTFGVVDQPSDGTNTTPELTFPHLGSVYEYFLKGIQTALRPKGYADPTPLSGQNCANTAICGPFPTDLPIPTSDCALGTTSSRIGVIPQTLKEIVEAAATTYKTPPNLILAIMYGEGIFNPGRFNWTDDNVKAWATCEPIPGCSESGGDNFIGFHESDWVDIVPHIKGDLLKIDPTRTSPSQCNLMDSIYGLAYSLHSSSSGSPYFPVGSTCFGKPLNSATNGGDGLAPMSCDWSNDSWYESAIRVDEFGTGWGNTAYGFFTCATNTNSCATGGLSAQCSTDTITKTDTCNNSDSSNSHNACVWQVAHGQ